MHKIYGVFLCLLFSGAHSMEWHSITQWRLRHSEKNYMCRRISTLSDCVKEGSLNQISAKKIFQDELSCKGSNLTMEDKIDFILLAYENKLISFSPFEMLATKFIEFAPIVANCAPRNEPDVFISHRSERN